MSRVLFWNLQTFGVNKINNPSLAKPPGIGGNTLQQASFQRFGLINSVFRATLPDLIVIVEVGSGDSYPADLATNTGGTRGAWLLLEYFRRVYPAQGWRLVPPLRVGQRNGSKPETVAVLYRGVGAGVRRYFTGPNRWRGGVDGSSIAAEAGLPGNAYPAARNLNAMLVPVTDPPTPPRTIPVGALHNAETPENTVAARVTFRESGGRGRYLDYGVFRPPYLATFTELTLATGAQRHLSIFGIHSPAMAGSGDVFISYLASTLDVMSPLSPNETRVIGGDFNVRLLAPNGAPSNVYAPLAPYVPLLQSAGAPPAAVLDAYRGYFATHIRPKPRTNSGPSQFLWSDPPAVSPYPGYGYTGSDRITRFESIDNILVWPHRPHPYSYQTTIMNSIVGTPFDQVAPVPGGAPIGSVPYIDQMWGLPATAVWPPVPNAAPVPNAGDRNNLTGWDNYGYQKSTSDHFALFAEV